MDLAHLSRIGILHSSCGPKPQPSTDPRPDEAGYEFIAVLDFEANCVPQPGRDAPEWDDPAHQISGFVNEIVEFPTVVLGRTPAGVGWAVVDEFREFVKPQLFPLTPFCTHLTGVRREDVEAAPDFETVFAWWKAFLARFPNALLATCGDWDLCTMLPLQLSLTRDGAAYASGDKKRFTASKRGFLRKLQEDGPSCELAPLTAQWCNIKLCYERATGLPRAGMAGMLRELELELSGSHHCGIDDCRSIAKICLELIRRHGDAALFCTTGLKR